MKIRHLLSLVVCLGAAASLRADYSFKEPFTRSGAFNSNGVVTLENVTGEVEIRTWDKNQISIEGEKSAKTEEELRQIDLTIDLSTAKAAIKVKLPKREGLFWGDTIRAAVRFKLRVPANVVLEKVSTVNSSIRIEGVRGAVNVSTVNGGVYAKELGGSAKLHTVNGPVDATFSQVEPNQKLSFDTVNGGVKIRLPKDAGFQLSGTTVNGGVSCEFPLSAIKKSRGNLSGTSGDGRATLKANTVNGGVHIESL